MVSLTAAAQAESAKHKLYDVEFVKLHVWLLQVLPHCIMHHTGVGVMTTRVAPRVDSPSGSESAVLRELSMARTHHSARSCMRATTRQGHVRTANAA